MRSFKRLGFATRQDHDDRGREKEFAASGPPSAGTGRAEIDSDDATESSESQVLAAVYDTSGREITPEAEASHPLDKIGRASCRERV